MARKHQAEFIRCMVDLDAEAARRLWPIAFPHLKAPRGRECILVMLHHARTQSLLVAPMLRFYSHRWLLDHGLPSGLPDNLKPRAERMYPKIEDAVGIAVGFRSPILKPLVPIVVGAMSDTVCEMYAAGDKDSARIKKNILETKDRTIKRLLGSVTALRQ